VTSCIYALDYELGYVQIGDQSPKKGTALLTHLRKISGCTLFSCFMLDRTAVIGGSNENGFAIFIFYARPNGGHGSWYEELEKSQ